MRVDFDSNFLKLKPHCKESILLLLLDISVTVEVQRSYTLCRGSTTPTQQIPYLQLQVRFPLMTLLVWAVTPPSEAAL